MFLDKIKLKLSAGRGGDGVVSWRREKYIPKGGPCGGNGGVGGSIIIQSCHHIFALDRYRNQHHITAENGLPGGTNQRQGRSGKTLTLTVPCGTIARNAETGAILHDFTKDGEELHICEGGKGGKGNTFFKTPTNRAPTKYTPGKLGESIEVELELKLIADVGFVGLPNAGKSTLLSSLTAHKVKIGDYPFTTLTPNLSYLQFDDFSRIYLADIPGLIEGAHVNRGLGFSFLKHVERSQVLVYIMDVAPHGENRSAIKDFKILRNELGAYSPHLLDKPFLVVLNKMDLPESQKLAEEFMEEYTHPKSSVLTISALNKLGTTSLVEAIRELAQEKGKRYV